MTARKAAPRSVKRTRGPAAAALTPLPPGESKDPHARYLDIREGEPLDEAQFARWVRQASTQPGWVVGK